MSTGRRIVKNFLSLSTAEALGRCVGFVTVIYLARILGAGFFGKINFVEAILSYFLLITNCGLNWIGCREVARDKAQRDCIIGTITGIKVVLFFISFILLCVLILFIDKPSDIKKLLFLYGFTLLPASFLIDWVFNGIERMEYIAAANLISKVIFLVLVFSVIHNNSQIFAIPIIKFLADMFVAISLIVIFNKLFGRIRVTFNKQLATDLLRKALPLGFSLYMIRIYYNFDTIILGFMSDDKTVGYYNAAYKIILVLIAFAGAFYSAIFPTISSYYKSSLDRLSKFQRKITKFLVIIALPLGFGGALLAGKIIQVVYGPEYVQSAVALQILIWTVVVILIDIPYANSLIAVDMQHRFTLFVTVSAVVNLVLNFLLIPRYGIVGAAIATVAAELTLFSFSFWKMSEIINNNPFALMAKPFLASIVMGIFIFSISKTWSLFYIVPLAAVIYFGVLYVLKDISADDIGFLRTITNIKR